MGELIGVRSGLRVSREEITRVLAESEQGSRVWSGKPVEAMTIRAEEFQAAFARLLHAVGATETPTRIEALVFDFARNHVDAFPDDTDSFMVASKVARVTNFVNDAVVNHVIWGTALPEEFPAIEGTAELVRSVAIRHVLSALPLSKTWDGALPLSQLFDGDDDDNGRSNSECYFDQRYIDYLAAQPDRLAQLHWRQFEHFTAEYFRRNGYAVTVGPGRDDGGVDITAKREDDLLGPAVVLVQCKRYSEGRPVGVEALRAFWATVDDQDATRGLVVTTSRLTAGAREYCEARRYRLNAVEGENVRTWLDSMCTSARPLG